MKVHYSPSVLIRFAIVMLSLVKVLPAQTALQSSVTKVSTTVARTGTFSPQTANLTSSTSTQIPYTASTAQNWIHLSGATSGTTPASLTISLNLSVLAPGTYHGSVILNAPSAAGGGIAIPVTATRQPFVAAPSGVLSQAPGSPLATGSVPAAVVVSDFNGDGKSDFATVNNRDNNVTVLLGNGSGGFTAAPGSPFAVGTSPVAIAAGDFNNDGKVDLAVANNASNNITVLLGNGSGGFAAAPGSPFGAGAFPLGLAIGDFSGDHNLDIAVINAGDRTVTLLLGDGAGGFTAQPGGVHSITTNPTGIAAGDFNADGVQDIVVSSSGQGGLATILLGSSSGFSAAPGSPFSVPGQSGANVTVGDWNLDGTLDLAFAGATGVNNTGVLTIFLGSGGGAFTLGSSLGVSTQNAAFYYLTSGDIDGDGNPDLVVTSPSIGQVYVFLGNGSGSFVQAPGGSIGSASDFSVQVADFNGDNRSDLVIANASTTGTATVLLGASDPVTVTAVSSTGSNAVLVGTPVTLSATVLNTGFFFRQPTGTVSFIDGATNLGSATLTNGTLTLNTSSLSVGTHSIFASYSGDTRNLAGPSSGVTVVVDGSAGSIAIYSGSPQTVSTNAQFAPLQAIVRDAGNLPIGGVSVTFTAPPSGASGIFASNPTVTTNSQGIATAPTFTANAIGGSFTVTASISSPSISANFLLTSVAPVALRYVPVTPCRIADTRNPNGPFGGPFLTGQAVRNFIIPNSACGIPSSAQAYSFNVAVVPQQGLGYLTVWPAGASQPLVATLNSDGRIKSNAAIIPAGSGGAISVFATNNTEFVLDINGYFVPASSSGSLSFYSVAPCRIADTRNAAGPLGGPFITGQSTRNFPVLSGSCGVPATAQAYSLNFAAVPRAGGLGYLTAWAAGQTQPLVATLNAPTGTVTANAGFVPAGTGGSISVFATNDTDLVIDIDGYFAPPGGAGSALSLYNLEPCRILDSRLPAGSPAFSGTINVTAASSVCGAPFASQGFVFNATVVPTQGLGFLTLWPQGTAQPLVATLNASDAAITGNLAIVPTTNGSISAFATNPTFLVLDIFGYFAP